METAFDASGALIDVFAVPPFDCSVDKLLPLVVVVVVVVDTAKRHQPINLPIF